MTRATVISTLCPLLGNNDGRNLALKKQVLSRCAWLFKMILGWAFLDHLAPLDLWNPYLVIVSSNMARSPILLIRRLWVVFDAIVQAVNVNIVEGSFVFCVVDNLGSAFVILELLPPNSAALPFLEVILTTFWSSPALSVAWAFFYVLQHDSGFK